MARPKSWFEPKDFTKAARAAKDRSHKLWKFSRNMRNGKAEIGYFVGTRIPIRLQRAKLELKATR
jgi:hypothetical protein